MDLHTLSIASGIGGLDIGFKRGVERHTSASVRTVCYIEREAYSVATLVKNMETGGGCLDDAPIWSDLTTFDPEPWRGKVDCIIGGYPCQPFSVAGKRLGTDDPRHLWPFIGIMVDVIRPSILFFENVPGHLSKGFDSVAHDISEMGYELACVLTRASETGAPHKRERMFVLAYTNDCPLRIKPGRTTGKGGQDPAIIPNDGQKEQLGNPNCLRERQPEGVKSDKRGWTSNPSWWELEPNVGRVANGVPFAAYRLWGLGNAVVSDQAELAFGLLHTELTK